MESVRKPFQGVANIVRFNWHFYVGAALFLVALQYLMGVLPATYQPFLWLLFWLTIATTAISLLVSYYVYDHSGLYVLDWMSNVGAEDTLVNIHAGFDETSELLAAKLGKSKLTVLNFYDPARHSEVSIRRARKAYPPFPGTKRVATSDLSLPHHSADAVFVIMAAHEIREEKERIIFFREIRRILKPNGQVFVVEHLRDTANFLAYNIGFLHFLSEAAWQRTFERSNLRLRSEQKITPFVTAYSLVKDGTTA